MFEIYQIKGLRLLAKIKEKRKEKQLNRLIVEKKLVYMITKELLTMDDSILELDPGFGIFYIKNGMKLVKFNDDSINLINGKFFYQFSFEEYARCFF